MRDRHRIAAGQDVIGVRSVPSLLQEATIASGADGIHLSAENHARSSSGRLRPTPDIDQHDRRYGAASPKQTLTTTCSNLKAGMAALRTFLPFAAAAQFALRLRGLLE